MSDPESELQPCGRFEWERIVRRCQMPVTTKLTAMIMAQYANRAGAQIRPGVPVLAAVLGLSKRSAERQLAVLRDLGLIEKTSNGGGPRKQAAGYRLTIPVDLMDRVSLLDPDETTPATQTAAVQVDNSRHTDGGSSDDSAGELPPSGTELPPSGDRTPANDPPLTCDDKTHQPDHPTTPPNKRLRGDVTNVRETSEERLIHLPPRIDLRAQVRARRNRATG